MSKEKTTWDVLSSINCSEFTEKKNGLTYLSWAHAWGYTKKNFPSANYEITMWDGKPYLFDKDLGYLVQTTVSIDGEKIGMQLPVMDGANKAQKNVPYTYEVAEWSGGRKTGKMIDKKVEQATMFDINTAIMRCLTKNLAMFGLGHYIYAGEDMPESVEEQQPKQSPIKNVETKPELPKETKPIIAVPKTDITPEEVTANLVIAKSEINEAKTTKELLSIYTRWSALTSNQEFMSAITKRKEQLINANQK